MTKYLYIQYSIINKYSIFVKKMFSVQNIMCLLFPRECKET